MCRSYWPASWEIARELLRRRAKVRLFTRTTEQIDEAAAMIQEEGGQALAVTVDLVNQSDVERALAQDSIKVRNASARRACRDRHDLIPEPKLWRRWRASDEQSGASASDALPPTVKRGLLCSRSALKICAR